MASVISCDLLVIGSGAGGLSAAVTAAFHGLAVIVAEKETVLGGTTAWSGGWMWAPLNPVAQRAGIIERGKPGIIGVLADGRRFCNEGDGYHDYVAVMLAAVPPGEEVASWLVCTRAFQRRYGLGIARPTPLPVGPYIRSGYIKTGRTLAELAGACGINPVGLERTMAEYNEHARRGEDPAFGRGGTLYNRVQGDPANTPNPCVAPIERGPFYAVKVVPGSFGTFAGLRTDGQARVLDAGVRRCRASMRRARTWRASWAATIRRAGSISGRP